YAPPFPYTTLFRSTGPALLCVERLLYVLKLSFQHLRGSNGLPFANLRVLFYVQSSQRIGDDGDHLWLAADIRDREGDSRASTTHRLVHTLQIQLNVAAHSFDHRVERCLLSPVGIQVEPIDQLGEPRAAHHLLADHLDAGVELCGH